jgi:hypothetical protein
MTHPYGKKISMVVTESSYGQLDKVTPEFFPIKEDFDRPAYIVAKAITVFLNRKYIDERTIVGIILDRNPRLAKEVAWWAVTHDSDWKTKINGIIEEENKNGSGTEQL